MNDHSSPFPPVQPEPEQEPLNAAPISAPEAAPLPEEAEAAAPATPVFTAPEPPAPQVPQPPVYTAPRPPHYSAPIPPVGSKPAAPKKKKRKGLGLAVAVIALCCGLIGSVCGGLIVGLSMRAVAKEQVQLQSPIEQTPNQRPTEDREPITQATRPSTQIPGTDVSADGLFTPAQVYANNVSAVVGISNESTSYNVFGQASEIASSGSGFIISQNGEILTNYHVIEGAQKLTVTLYDGRQYDAKVLGFEASSDVALIKIDETDLPYVTLGNSDLLYVGDEVAAIGNPLGELTYSMTVGYVSAMDRYVNTDGTPINMMQIDAAINSGNSGGPLFDMYGTVVGIITAKYSGTTGSGTSIEGIGFAIPINDVLSILEDLREDGAVLDRAYMGVKVSTVTASDIDRFGLPKGVLLESVDKGGAADRAGLKKGDILLKLDDTVLEVYEDLTAALKKYRAEDTAVFTVYRDGKELKIEIEFDAKPTEEPTEAPTEEEPEFPWDYFFP